MAQRKLAQIWNNKMIIAQEFIKIHSDVFENTIMGISHATRN